MKKKKQSWDPDKELFINAVKDMFGNVPKNLTEEDNDLINSYMFDKINPRWLPLKINGEDTRYKINNIGQICSKTGHIIKSSKNKSGLSVSLRIDNKTKYFKVEELVAYAFLTNINNSMYVVHINDNPFFNWFRNLKFSDERETHRRSPNNKKSVEKVIADIKNETIVTPSTPKEIEVVKEITSTTSERYYSESQIINIFNLLAEDKLSFSEISRITNCSRKLVLSISELASVLACIDNN